MISSHSGSSKCPAVLSQRPICFFFSPFLLMASRCEPFDLFDHSSGQLLAGLVLTRFFVSLPQTHMYPSGGFLSSRANRVTPMQSSDSDLSPSCFPIITDGRLVKYTNACRCFSLGINVIQRYRKSVLRNKEFRFKSNIIPKYPMSNSIPENLSSFNIWTWISGFFLF